MGVAAEKYLEEISHCMNCGFCQAVCPLYLELREEGLAARGKLNLIKAFLRGELAPSKRLTQYMARCLSCKSCGVNCPSGVEVDIAILGARGEMVRLKGLPLGKRLVFRGIMRDRNTFVQIARLMALIQKVFPGRKEGNLRHLPSFLTGIRVGLNIPPLARRSLRCDTPEITPGKGKTRMRVGLFTGCLVDFLYPEVGKAALGVLTRFGVEVAIPKDQTCCGLPLLMEGDMEGARWMAERNIKAFKDAKVEAIINCCATCGSAFKEKYGMILERKESLEEYQEFRLKVFDISEFLVKFLELPHRGKWVVSPLSLLTVTYHDPCHLCRGQGITSQPRQLLSFIPGVKYVEMEEADRCCGSGGLFSLLYHDLSRRVASRKIEAIEETGAHWVITGCPGCMMKLKEEMAYQDKHLSVFHTVQVLERYLQ